jgi:tetratricopeptide (TPR) repeat protein
VPPDSPFRDWLASVALALMTAAAYANTLGAPFVYDDKPSILDNPTLRQLWPLGPVLSPPGGGVTVDGRPLLNLSFAINHGLGGVNPIGYHLLNLIIHLGAGLLLFGVARRTLRRPRWRGRFDTAALPLAWTMAALWLLHPLQTEAITYVVQRAESLAGFFGLLTLYGLVRSLDSAGPRRWQVLSVLACLSGMAVKEIVVVIPVLVFLYDRTFGAGSIREAWRRRRGYYLGLAATWLLLGWLVLSTGGNRGGSRGFGLGLSWWEYELTQFPVLVRYLALSFWPHPLVFEYGPFWVHHATEVIFPAIVMLAVIAATLHGLSRNAAVGFLGAWFFAILAPTSLLPGASQMIVEHRMYLPLAAVIGLVVPAAYGALNQRRGVALVVGVLFAGLGALTFQRNQIYRSEITLWQDTVTKRPNNLIARGSLGAALALAGRLEEAIAEDRASLRVEPNYMAFNNLGSALISLGRGEEAEAALRDSVRLNPKFSDSQLNLGVALELLKRPAEALPHFELAQRLNPASAQAASNLGDALSRAGRRAEGIAYLEQALRLKPDLLEAHFNLAAALVRAGRMAEAQAQFEAGLALRPASAEAFLNWCNVLSANGHPADAMAQYAEGLRWHPESAELHYSYGSVLAAAGRMEEAHAQFEEALRLRPDYPEAHNNLGNALTLLRREAEALPHYQAALQLNPANPIAHNNLGLALARLGRIQEAAVEFGAAVRLAPNYAEARENLARAEEQVRQGP